MEKLAIIGTGIAGMGAADLLRHKYDITVFEQNDYVGGHTNTIKVDEDGKDIFIDTGFMVFNYHTYPFLSNLFKMIGAPVKKSDMSFSVQHVVSGLEYCGSGLKGVFAQRKNIFNLRFIKMLLQVQRFNKDAVKILDDERYADWSLGKFIKEFRYSEDMLWKYLVPMSAAVWSSPMDKMLEFPAVTLIRFFKNHGFLGLNTQHQWYTLEHGSQSYREILIRPFKDRIQVGNGVDKVYKVDKGGAAVHCKTGVFEFDKVVFACHGDQALALLGAPTTDEARLLKNFKYQVNTATVHTDSSIMPKNKKTWSSWNYRIEDIDGKPVPTTIYWMNSLQGVSDKKDYFVSINAVPGSVDKTRILKEIAYEHPLFDVPAIQAQAELHLLNETGPLYFCGSYFKYGFHEDAYASAVKLAEKILNG